MSDPAFPALLQIVARGLITATAMTCPPSSRVRNADRLSARGLVAEIRRLTVVVREDKATLPNWEAAASP